MAVQLNVKLRKKYKKEDKIVLMRRGRFGILFHAQERDTTIPRVLPVALAPHLPRKL
jgi:hypothetical protein